MKKWQLEQVTGGRSAVRPVGNLKFFYDLKNLRTPAEEKLLNFMIMALRYKELVILQPAYFYIRKILKMYEYQTQENKMKVYVYIFQNDINMNDICIFQRQSLHFSLKKTHKKMSYTH